MSDTNKPTYKTIVIDPPWDLKFHRLKIRPNQIKLPYKTMSDSDINDFSIDNFADVECNLFFWTTHTKLPISLNIIKNWGFKYHCLLTWDKTNGRPCWGFMRKTEFVIYAYRGQIGVNQRGKFIPTLFTEKLRKHSEKPDIFYDILKANTPSPRIDIFARKKRDGWDVWGDEV